MTSPFKVIGVDFDNTVSCYDALFHRLALERGLIPPSISIAKHAVRDYLRSQGMEQEWTALQAAGYGRYMGEATPFPGAREFFGMCRTSGIRVHIISHRTRYPFHGPPCDLHQAAHQWLSQQGFYDESLAGLTPGQVSFLQTKREKLAQIRNLACTHFIDDLPEFLEDPDFPSNVVRILFDPHTQATPNGYRGATSWSKVVELVGLGR